MWSCNRCLLFAIALELDLSSTQDLIGRAGYTLTHSSKLDIIVEYFIVNKRCINAANDNLISYCDDDFAKIIVWEKEFSLSDPALICWQVLYERNLVPDAALTHEYWYLKPVCMEGSYYTVTDIAAAIESKKIAYIIKAQDKPKVLAALVRFGIPLDAIEDIDACTLVNQWLPRNYAEDFPIILEEIKAALYVSQPVNDRDHLAEYQIFKQPLPSIDTILDMEPLGVYCNLIINKCTP